MKSELLIEARKVWDRVSLVESVHDENLQLLINKKIFEYFQVGPSYYYIFDMSNATFQFVSPDVRDVLGYSSEEMTVELFMSRIHPDDGPVMLNHEHMVIDFYKRLPVEKITKYKFSYDYRVRSKSDKYIRLYQQVIVLQYDERNNALRTLGIHTDISHLKTSNRSVLSFIGLEGEPSFVNVAVKEIYKPSKELFTRREKEIVRQLISGKKTVEIATDLFISKHTVDTHRKNILAKTSTKSVVELAAKVVAEGLM